MTLSDTKIKSAKPKEKPYKLSDGEGLYIEVHPNGGKYWRFKYRFYYKEQRKSLGIYPSVSLKKARRRRAEARLLLDEDINPGWERKRLREDCALQAHGIQQPGMVALAKPSQQPGTESCVVSGDGHCEA